MSHGPVRPVPVITRTAPIDHAVLAELMRDLDDVDGEVRRELIASYLVESREQVRSLVAFGVASDAVGAATVAHSLRSSSALLGATELAGLLDQFGTGGSLPSGLTAHVAKVEAEYQRVIVSLEALQTGKVVVA